MTTWQRRDGVHTCTRSRWPLAAASLGLGLWTACAHEVQPTADAGPELAPLGEALDGEETIEVVGCSPGFLQLGEGAATTCIPDPSWASQGGSDPLPEEGDEDGRGPKGGPPKRTPPKRPKRPVERTCKPPDLSSPAAGECVKKLGEDLMDNHVYRHRVVCYSDGTKACCVEPVPGAPPGFVPYCEPFE